MSYETNAYLLREICSKDEASVLWEFFSIHGFL